MKNVLFKAGVVFLILSMFKKKEDLSAKENAAPITNEALLKAFKNLKTEFGTDIAKNVERMYRLETAHFKSSQFKKTYSAGMERFSEEFPFGWGNELRNFVKEYPEYGTEEEFSTLPFTESKTGKKKYFVKFPSLEAAIMFLGYVMKQRKNNAGSWYSTKEESQKRYNDTIKKIEPTIINSINKKV